jgi:hypothetical protein
MIRDAKVCSRVFEMKGPLGLQTEDDFIECLGLESHLRQDMIDRIAELEKRHCKLVLVEQARSKITSTGSEKCNVK